MNEADFIKAEELRGQGYFLKAERLYRRVLAGGPRRDPELWIEAALGSAAGLRSLGRVRSAGALLDKADAVTRSLGRTDFEGRIELEDALVDRAAGKFGRSIRRLKVLLRRGIRSRDWAQAAFVEWALGGAYRFRGDLRASHAAFKRSLSWARRIGDRAAQGYALFGLGGVTRILGKLDDSSRHYHRAMRIFRGSDDVFARAYAQCGYANALRQLGRLGEAEAHYQRAWKLYSGLEDEVDLAYVEWGLGKIYLHRGELSKAKVRLERALRLFSQGAETRGVILTEMAMAQLRHAQGDSRRAEALFESAVRRARANGLRTHLESYT